MKRADSIVRMLLPDIENRTILEAACGSAEFSIAASSYAREAHCIDVVDSRLDARAARANIHFEIMDAAQMRYPDGMFDTVVIYNALAHIREQWEAIQSECMRVLRPGGKLCIVGTWKLDTALMEDMFSDAVRENEECSVVELCKAC